MTTTAHPSIPQHPGARILKEGYGAGAWHGPDLKAALADITPDIAFRRPAEGRHNIAEIALHHAYTVRAVRGRLSAAPLDPFVLDGEDWFPLDGRDKLSWAQIQALVEDEQRRLETLVDAIESGRSASPLTDIERFDVVLGITCHAVYHAGQVQLVKRLLGA